MSNSIIKEKSFHFSLEIIKLYKILIENKEFVIPKHLLKSGASIVANVKEALAGQSKADFLSKMYIAFKEANETEYWLELLEKSKIIKLNYDYYLELIRELIRLLSSITKTTASNLKSKTKNS